MPRLFLIALLCLAACADPEVCNDGEDNDKDGRIDCQDADCAATSGCDGAPCTVGEDCRGNLCLSETNNGFPEGSCSTFCDLAAPECPFGPDALCVDINLGDGRGICFDGCASPSDCRDLYRCQPVSEEKALCFPNCQSAPDCATAGHCNLDNGFCEVTPEVCNNSLDDDGEGRFDCLDLDCALDPICDPALTCNAALDASLGTITDDTLLGVGVFQSSCMSDFGGQPAREKIFVLTPANSRALRLTLSSPSVQGVYVRTSCPDEDSELGCESNFTQNPTELILAEEDITVGQPLFIFVDGFFPGQEGPYTLLIEEVLAESDCLDFVDEDFDGATDCSDPDCQPQCAPGAGVLGAPCDAPSDCAIVNQVPACKDEVQGGFPSGYCTGVCVDSSDCFGGLCQNGLCFEACSTQGDCTTPGYECRLVLGLGDLCAPFCTSNADCPTAGFCNLDEHLCNPQTEDCANTLDDDNDEQIDCEDEDCRANEPSCDESINCGDGLDNDADLLIDCEDAFDCGPSALCDLAGLCAGATPLVSQASADTTLGSQQFAGSCTGGGLAHELLFLVTPGSAGQTGDLFLTLTSATDQGMYARADCLDTFTELNCQDNEFGGLPEQMTLFSIPGGEPVTIFVDGFRDPLEAGPFTLTISFTPL